MLEVHSQSRQTFEHQSDAADRFQEAAVGDDPAIVLHVTIVEFLAHVHLSFGDRRTDMLDCNWIAAARRTQIHYFEARRRKTCLQPLIHGLAADAVLESVLAESHASNRIERATHLRDDVLSSKELNVVLLHGRFGVFDGVANANNSEAGPVWKVPDHPKAPAYLVPQEDVSDV